MEVAKYCNIIGQGITIPWITKAGDPSLGFEVLSTMTKVAPFFIYKQISENTKHVLTENSAQISKQIMNQITFKKLPARHPIMQFKLTENQKWWHVKFLFGADKLIRENNKTLDDKSQTSIIFAFIIKATPKSRKAYASKKREKLFEQWVMARDHVDWEKR